MNRAGPVEVAAVKVVVVVVKVVAAVVKVVAAVVAVAVVVAAAAAVAALAAGHLGAPTRAGAASAACGATRRMHQAKESARVMHWRCCEDLTTNLHVSWSPLRSSIKRKRQRRQRRREINPEEKTRQP